MKRIQRTCVLVILTTLGLASVPVALGTYVFAHWLPEQIRRSRAESAIEQARRQTERAWQRIADLRARIEQVKRAGDGGALPWAPDAQTFDVLEHLTQCFVRCGAELRQLRGDEPVLCGVVSPDDVLAADPVTLEAVGSYQALTRAFDAATDDQIPLRIQQMDWSWDQNRVRLVLKAQIPFCADEAIRKRLIGDAALLEALEGDADEP